jgi:hypothetical protein
VIQQPARCVVSSSGPIHARGTRLSFLKASAGAAAFAAAIGVPAAGALSGAKKGAGTDRSSPRPQEPVMPYRQLEISPADDDEHRSHKEVLERGAGGRPAHTAVFDALPAGTDTPWSEGIARVRDVAVPGGQIVELSRPGAARAAA